jgi:hypothetical protein
MDALELDYDDNRCVFTGKEGKGEEITEILF